MEISVPVPTEPEGIFIYRTGTIGRWYLKSLFRIRIQPFLLNFDLDLGDDAAMQIRI